MLSNSSFTYHPTSQCYIVCNTKGIVKYLTKKDKKKKRFCSFYLIHFVCWNSTSKLLTSTFWNLLYYITEYTLSNLVIFMYHLEYFNCETYDSSCWRFLTDEGVRLQSFTIGLFIYTNPKMASWTVQNINLNLSCTILSLNLRNACYTLVMNPSFPALLPKITQMKYTLYKL
jgi:hypothetical protein